MALVDKIINAIKDIENYRFDKEVAELLDMDNKALATYKSRGELPQYYIKFFCKRYGVELKNLDAFLGNIDKYNKNIIGNKQSGSVINKGKDKKMDYIIEAQQETIKLQKEKIKQLEDKNNKNVSVYDGIQSDIVFAFEIKFNWSLKNPGIKVKYLSQESTYIPIMAKKLGYTESELIELLQIDEFVDYKNHKIHMLRTEKQKQEMLGIMNNFMNAYRGIKMNTTLLVAEIPVLYNHKNGAVFKANVEYRVNWVNGTGTAHIRWCAE
jgi:hypothetical protein